MEETVGKHWGEVLLSLLYQNLVAGVEGEHDHLLCN